MLEEERNAMAKEAKEKEWNKTWETNKHLVNEKAIKQMHVIRISSNKNTDTDMNEKEYYLNKAKKQQMTRTTTTTTKKPQQNKKKHTHTKHEKWTSGNPVGNI